MVNIKELKKICQPKGGFWLARNIYRPISVWITYLVVKTPLNANMISVIGALFLVAGALFLVSLNRNLYFVSAIFLQLSVLLDHVDGEVARYWKSAGYGGKYMDLLGHTIGMPILFICLGLNIYFQFDYKIFLYLSVLIGVAMAPISRADKDFLLVKLMRAKIKKHREFGEEIEEKRWSSVIVSSLNQRRDFKNFVKIGIKFIKKFLDEIFPKLLISVAIILDLIFSPFSLFGYLVNFKLICFLLYGIPIFLSLPLSIYANYIYLRDTRS